MKKKIVIYRIIALIIGFIGILVSIGVIGPNNNYFYLFFTNLSNYCCYIYLLIDSILYIKNKGNYNTFNLTIKFCLTISIMLTFIVADLILFNIFTKSFWNNDVLLMNIFLHFFMPLFFIIDYFLFTNHEKVNKFMPIYSTIFPLLYVLIILIRAQIIGRDSSMLLYPYFFIDVNALGYGNVLLWVLGLGIVFVFFGYLIYFSRNIKKK